MQWGAYNHTTREGRLEIDNVYGKRGAGRADKALARRLSALLDAG